MRLFQVIALLTTISSSALAQVVPDRTRTPGLANPAVTQETIGRTICRTGFTDEVRPAASITGALKRDQIKDYGYADRNPGRYQEDHLIPLELGGAPNDARNLWPQANQGAWNARFKDTLENELRRRVCSDAKDADHISLAEAQAAIAGDWIVAYRKYVCMRHAPPLTQIMRTQCR